MDDLNFSLERGVVTAFLGRNGAGKTTTVNLLCGLTPPNASRAWIGDWPAGSRVARAALGLCPQGNVVWPDLTCREQLEYSGRLHNLDAREARRRALELLDALDLNAKARSLARTLSGGLARRLSPMALVHRPRLVITDEAEAGLDPQSRGQVREHLRSLTPGCTILACSHDMAEMERLARRVIILEAGRIAAQGSPEDLKHALGLASVLTLDLSGAPDALGGAFAQAARLVGNVTREGSTLTANG